MGKENFTTRMGEHMKVNITKTRSTAGVSTLGTQAKDMKVPGLKASSMARANLQMKKVSRNLVSGKMEKGRNGLTQKIEQFKRQTIKIIGRSTNKNSNKICKSK
jgi:hypothetical protein